MASYADVASRGPKQTDEEKRAPALDEVIVTDTSIDSLIDVDSGVSVVPSDFNSHEVKTETQEKRLELEAEAQELAEKAKLKSSSNAERAKGKVKKFAAQGEEYARNPVISGNVLLDVLITGFIGYYGVKKYRQGTLTWKVVGIWTAGLAAFGVADYFASSFLMKKWDERKSNKKY